MSCDDEARASDLRVLLESLEAHHSEILGRETFLQVYAQWEGSYSVIQAFQILEQRGRYNCQNVYLDDNTRVASNYFELAFKKVYI